MISTYVLPPAYTMMQHAHLRAGLVVILDGHFATDVEGVPLEATAGQVLILPAGAPHIEWARSGARCLLVELGDAPHLDGFEKLVQCPGVRQVGSICAMGHRLEGDLLGADDRDLVLDAAAAELFLRVQTNQEGPLNGAKSSPLVRHIVEVVEQRWRHPPRLSDLANENGVSAEHLARAFRSTTGCTIGDYLRRQRLLNAAWRVRNSSQPLAAVAHWAGYADQSHMTRQFRRYLGITPGAYRLNS